MLAQGFKVTRNGFTIMVSRAGSGHCYIVCWMDREAYSRAVIRPDGDIRLLTNPVNTAVRWISFQTLTLVRPGTLNEAAEIEKLFNVFFGGMQTSPRSVM